MTGQMTDKELLEAIDSHEADCNSYEAERVEKLLKWVTGTHPLLNPGRPLRLNDRKWAKNLLDQLDDRL